MSVPCASLLYFVVRVGCRRQFTFAISSPDELLVMHYVLQQYAVYCRHEVQEFSFYRAALNAGRSSREKAVCLSSL